MPDPSTQSGAWNILRRVYGLLNRRERKTGWLLLAAVLLNSVVDLLGLAVVIPVIGLVINPELMETHEFLGKVYDVAFSWGIGSQTRFLIALCLFLIGAFLFKTLFGLWVNHVQTRFGFRVAHRLSGNLWMHHFSDSLERLRSKSSGRILEEINGWPILFARVFITGGQLYFNELVVMALLAIGLTAYSPMVFLGVASIIGTGGLLIRWLTKRRLQRNSATLRTIAPQATSLVSNAVRGFLELVTFRAVRAMQANYLSKTRKLYAVHSNQLVLGIAPARLYEFLAVSALCTAIIVSLTFGNAGPAFFESLSLLALSAYRVMPAMARVNARMIAMRGQMHLIDAMETGASASTAHPLPANTPTLQGPISIEIQDLAARYEGKETVVFQGLKHRFEAGKLSTITGPSGSGKSTLVSMLLGLHAPDHGQVSVQSVDKTQALRSELSTADWLGNVAYLPQQPFLFEGTVRDNLTLGGAIADLDEPHMVHLLSTLRLTEALGEHPLDFLVQEGGSNLSGGQQQRLALIRALQLKRPVLILDEATSSLDRALGTEVLRILEEEASQGTTVILITHDEAVADQFGGIRLG